MSSSIRVIDDVVSDIYQKHIENMMSSLEWYFEPSITFDHEIDPNSGFSNVIVDKFDNIRKGQTDFLLPLLYEGISKYKSGAVLQDLYKLRAVMWIRNQNKGAHLPHQDLAIHHHTMVYYVNDTDAPTRLYKDNRVFKEVQPKKGRALIFPGNTQHASASPTETSRRMVLNFNFLL